jgi:hypothetical protein
MSIRCGKCKGRHETASAVRACYMGQGQAAPAAPQERRTAAPATEGVYTLNGVIYKVKKALHGSGRLYAVAYRDGSWEMEPGMVRQLTQDDRMTLEAAAAYGHLYGRCVRCQTALTDEKSISLGIGPVCRTKL